MVRSKKTGELLRELNGASNIRDYFNRNGSQLISVDLPTRLQQLIDAEGINRSELAVRCGLDRYYVYDIFRGRKIPGVNKLMCIILGMDLNLDTAQELFRLAGRPELYPRFTRDSILIYAIDHHLTVDETNALLFERGQSLLTE